VSTRAKWTMVWAGWAAYFAVAEYMALRVDEYDAPRSLVSVCLRTAEAVPQMGTEGRIVFVHLSAMYSATAKYAAHPAHTIVHLARVLTRDPSTSL